MKKIIITTLSITLIISAWLSTSPFKYNAKSGLYQLENKITINQPVEKVFSYLGNSGNASKWSSYVSHIKTINPNEVKDGTTGSIRRCFKKANEQGIVWDEEITQVKTNQLRELSIFNLNGFPIKSNDLFTQQQYHPVSKQQTILVFGLYKPKTKLTGFTDWLKLKSTGYYVAFIFNKNLNNIKKEIESLS